MDYIDLHVHSTASDGTFTPSELVAYALKKGLKAFALTDHDSIDGLLEAEEAAAGTALELAAGIEFSTEYQGKDIHILGLCLNWRQKGFNDSLRFFKEERQNRNREMAERLRRLEGMDISLERLEEAFPGAVITRAHFAKYLFEKNYVRDIRDAFSLYIGDSCPCFVPRNKISPTDAIELILKADGIPVLAHPLLYPMTEHQLDSLVKGLKSHGLQGLEAIYSSNCGLDETNMRRLARKYQLKISGGSDFHGSIKPHIDIGVGRGNLKIPYEILENLRGR